MDDPKPSKGRRRLANPHLDQPLDQRLEKAGAVDLRGNYVRHSSGNGYSTIVPIDGSKRFRAKK